MELPEDECLPQEDIFEVEKILDTMTSDVMHSLITTRTSCVVKVPHQLPLPLSNNRCRLSATKKLLEINRLPSPSHLYRPRLSKHRARQHE